MDPSFRDVGLFTINSATGEIRFVTPPDFENPTDSDTDNIYVVEVTADDGNSGTDVQTINVTVTDVAQTITATGAASVNEGEVFTLNLSATDNVTYWTINWGDGAIDTIAGNATTATHVYTNGGLTNETVEPCDANSGQSVF